MQEQLVALIVETVSELSESEELELDGELRPDTVLFGEDGVMDSMGLVSLIVALEQVIEERFDCEVALADDKALSQRASPYRSVESLASYAATQIADAADGAGANDGGG